MPANPLGLALRNRHAGHHTLVWARPAVRRGWPLERVSGVRECVEVPMETADENRCRRASAFLS